MGDVGFKGASHPVPEGNDPVRPSAVPGEPGQEMAAAPPVGLDPIPVRLGVEPKVVGGGQTDAELASEPVGHR